MEWQNFLNLCICQESQLQRVEDYRRVSLWPGTGVAAAGDGGGVQRQHGATEKTELGPCA